jgi:hypothetical protein
LSSLLPHQSGLAHAPNPGLGEVCTSCAV